VITLFVYLLAFFLGLIWGSFINMAVYRVKKEISFSGRSFCDHTKKNLGWQDLIPVLSFLIYKGKCRHCKKPIPPLYPVVEVITGISFVITLFYLFSQEYSSGWMLMNALLIGTFVLFFIFFAAYDYLYWEVNVKAIKTALAYSILVTLILLLIPEAQSAFANVWSILSGIIAGMIIFLIVKLTKGSGMGEGDIYLMAFAGMFVGLSGLIPLFMISSISGSIVGIIKALKVKKLHGVQIQFVPFISFAALMVFFFKDIILRLLYLDNLQIFFNG